MYQKHHPPHFRDEIWRLERIAKDGALHKRLAIDGVKSVQDFLRLYMIDPTKLRNVRESLFFHTLISFIKLFKVLRVLDLMNPSQPWDCRYLDVVSQTGHGIPSSGMLPPVL